MISSDTRAACAARRARLATLLGDRAGPWVLAAGGLRSRNFPANTYRFRASSHFLYLVGAQLPDAVLGLRGTDACLFAPPPDPEDALWHGPKPDADALAQSLGIEVRPLSALAPWLGGEPAAWVAPVDPEDRRTLARALGRESTDRRAADRALCEALVTLRLIHDDHARAQLREAAKATVRAHRAGMRATRAGDRECVVCAAMEGSLAAEGCGVAYGSIVTTHGEVLHDHDHHRVMGPGDLLLCDVGAETPGGWAGDVTRTWPVSGRFSPTQRTVYELVLAAQAAAIERVRPGARFRDVHLAAARALTEGLVREGVLRGDVDGLLERGAHALFFPHGVGHLLGLDVHDMEDLGDLAGYPTGRARDPQFGLRYLRLDRDLRAGMAVTIEPGFYQVPALLARPEAVGLSGSDLDRDRLARFADVRGIRIEDDLLVTDDGCEVLTSELEKRPEEIQSLVG